MEENLNPDLNSLPTRRRFRTWHLALPLVIFGALAFVLPASPFSAAGKNAACLENSKQLMIAMAIYSGDFDDRFPSDENWRAVSAEYLQGSGKCPSGEYGMNTAIAGLDAFAIENPGQTPVLFDAKAAAGGASDVDFRHGGHASIGLADGSSKSFKEDEAGALLWTPSLLKL